MAYNVTDIGYLDVDAVSTNPVSLDRISSDRKELGEDSAMFALWISDHGPNGEGVHFKLSYSAETSDDKPLCEFYIPDYVWPTFVAAVECTNKMRSFHTRQD